MKPGFFCGEPASRHSGIAYFLAVEQRDRELIARRLADYDKGEFINRHLIADLKNRLENLATLYQWATERLKRFEAAGVEPVPPTTDEEDHVRACVQFVSRLQAAAAVHAMVHNRDVRAWIELNFWRLDPPEERRHHAADLTTTRG